MTTEDLPLAVGRFVDELTSILDGLTRRTTSYRALVVDESDSLVSAVMAADGRISQGEAEAYARAVGRHVTRNGRPIDALTARTSDHLLRRKGWEAAPSELFRLLVAADRRSGTRPRPALLPPGLGVASAAAAADSPTATATPPPSITSAPRCSEPSTMPGSPRPATRRRRTVRPNSPRTRRSRLSSTSSTPWSGSKR